MASGLSCGAHLLSVDSPVPPVSEPRAPDAGQMQVPPGNPLLLSLTLQELLARDAVQVELVPEKKGLFLKHVEYEVSSQVPAGLGEGAGGSAGRTPSACPCVLLWLAAPPPQAPARPHHPRALGSCLSGRLAVSGAQMSWPWAVLRCWAVPGEKSVDPAPQIKCAGGTGVRGSSLEGAASPSVAPQGQSESGVRHLAPWPCAGCPLAQAALVFHLLPVLSSVRRVLIGAFILYPGD